MKKPRRDKAKMLELEKWLALHKDLQSLMDDMSKLFGSLADGKLENTVWEVFNTYTDLLADKVGDTSHEWLDWYLWDNEAGERGLEAKAASWRNAKPIKTLTDLYDVINDG